MQTTNYADLINLMNEAGAKRRPFVFGIDYELSEGFFVQDPFASGDFLFDISNRTNTAPPAPCTRNYRFEPRPITSADYSHRFEHIRRHLLHGNSFLANLTVSTPIECSLSLAEIFAHTAAPYRFYLPGRFVCFSPERFVRISSDGLISSNPMKGTIDASLPNAQETLLADYKETAEHYTIVDLIRNDLSRVARSVKVNRFRYIDRIETNTGAILQMSSEISGRLDADWHSRLGTILADLLPAGSICGAPKEATVLAIQEAEKAPRGYYTGIAGLYDGETLDSAVLIRYIEQTPHGLVFRSGGGITINSHMQAEYEEVIQKVYLPILSI